MADGKHPGASGTDLAAGVNDHGVLQRSERRLAHPSGKEGYGRLAQVLRGLAFTVYFTSCCLTLVMPHSAQLSLGRPYSAKFRLTGGLFAGSL